MPPGSRKRKAAKKKKEQETTIHSTTNSQGNHDLKTHDEKGSDSGDISSPRSEDHHHPLVEEEEEGKEEKRDSSSFGSVAAANSKPMEGTQNGAGDGEGEIKQMVVSEEVEVLQVDGEMKPGEDLESKDVSIEYVQYAKESRVGGSSGDAGSSSSGSSSSDDESRLVEKNSLVIETGKLEEEEKSDGLIIETVPPVDSVPLTEEMTEAVETTMVSNTVVSDAIDVASKVKEEILLPSSQEAGGVSGVIDLVSNGNEEKILQASDAPTVDTSNDGGGEHREESDIPVGSENQQPQLVLAPPTVPPTSWKSCCGLFDVLWGSNR